MKFNATTCHENSAYFINSDAVISINLHVTISAVNEQIDYQSTAINLIVLANPSFGQTKTVTQYSYVTKQIPHEVLKR
jgi:hypothetical protein